MKPLSRRDIYYWKCDRPAAFHGTQIRGDANAEMAELLRDALHEKLNAKRVELSPGAGQGNHITWNAEVDGASMFVRVENGPEQDGQLAVESAVLDLVRDAGVRTPRVYACDASRSRVPFAWQALERIAAPDLNQWFKQGTLEVSGIACKIGVAVAKWQAIKFEGFGVLEHDDVGRVFAGTNEPGGSAKKWTALSESHPPNTPGLRGCRSSYADYFHLRLDDHLRFLTERGFLANTAEILAEMTNHRSLLDLAPGCLVHKDLALWNILGTDQHISAFIDFDDSIAGDPMDDLSLLACFHDAAFLRRAFEGYKAVRSLPGEYLRRFWMHLLRNMIVKAVIRVGAGYFDRADNFFLIGAGGSGGDLRRFTEQRLALALRGLREELDLEHL